ncbi:Endo-1-4-beta-xylanase 1 [Apiospora arundinis]
MPGRPEGLVLTVDPNVIHKVDTANAQNLFNMWTDVQTQSSKAAAGDCGTARPSAATPLRESYNKQSPLPSPPSTAPKDIPDVRIPEVPQLSGSVDSVAEDEEAIEFSSESEPMEISRPRILRQDSSASNRSRGRERHITSDHLEKMVVSIIQDKEPNLAPLTDMSSPSLEPESDDSQTAYSTPDVQQTPDTPTTPATEPMCHSSVEAPSVVSASLSSSGVASSGSERASSRTTVIRGFSPSQVSIPALQLRSQESMKQLALGTIPEPQAAPAYRPVQLKKQPAKFALGGSSGDESSPQSLMQHKSLAPQGKPKMFQLGASSGSAEDPSPSLKSAMHSARPNSLLNAQKKQTSFSNQVSMRTIQTQSSDEQSDSYIDESAIDDDEDDSEWEDSIEEGGKESMDDPVTFKRVPSKPNLTSHRSNLSLMFAAGQEQQQRPRGLGAAIASQSTSALQRARTLQNIPTVKATSPNDSDDSGLEMKGGMRRTPLRPIKEIPRSTAQPIMTNANATQRQSALSPRTTRRNMLHHELTESLRRQLLWERQQKTSTANAVLKRRHTSHDVANLKQYPEKVYMNKTEETNEEPNATSWNQYLERDAVGGYHAQGW